MRGFSPHKTSMSDSEFDLGKPLSKGDYKVIASQHIQCGNKRLPTVVIYSHTEAGWGNPSPKPPGADGKKDIFP